MEGTMIHLQACFPPWDIKDLTLSGYTTLINLAIPRKPDPKRAVTAPADRGKSGSRYKIMHSPPFHQKLLGLSLLSLGTCVFSRSQGILCLSINSEGPSEEVSCS